MTCHQLRAIVAVMLCACGATVENSDPTGPFDCKGKLPAGAAVCTVDADCTTVTVGCYCGPQPVNGISRQYAKDAQACEDDAASKCALGCLVEFKMLAQDGQKADPGATIAVHCDRAGGTGTCKSYLP